MMTFFFCGFRIETSCILASILVQLTKPIDFYCMFITINIKFCLFLQTKGWVEVADGAWYYYQNIPLGIIKSMKYVCKIINRKCYDKLKMAHWLSLHTSLQFQNCMLFNSCSNKPPAAVFRSVKCCSGFCNTLIFLVNFVFLVFAASGSRTGREGVSGGFSCQTECKWVCTVLSCCALKKQI